VAEDIPILGSLVKLIKVGIGVREYLFLRKLAKFLLALNSIPDADRESFRERVDADPRFRDSVGEKLLLLLERADDLDKPALIGKAFGAFLQRRIDYDQFVRMAAGLDRALMADLRRLAQVSGPRIEEPWGADLVPAGITVMSVHQLVGGNLTDYPLTETGALVRDICLR
jgi:hypothetical protein